MNNWIPTKDGLPQHEEPVLVWQVYDTDVGTGARIMRYRFNSWEGPGFGAVTHWMPLPEAPK